MLRKRISWVAVVIASLGAVTAVPASQSAAQDGPEPSAAERCFQHHKFGAQPVDVAKSSDGQTVLAQVSWGYHETIGCYLTLDDEALATLRANAQSEPTPDPTVNPTPEPTPDPTVNPTPEPTPDPTVNPTPEPTPDPTVNPTPEPTPDPTVNPTPEPTPDPTVNPTPVLVSRSGTGTDIVAVVLTEGTHIVEIEATAATGYFGVTVSQAGSTCDLLVNEIVDDRGVWTGRKALNVGGFASCEAGSAVIEVDAEADARWTAGVKPVPEPVTIPASRSGVGSDVFAVALTEGTHIVEIEATAATGYFGVTVSQAGSTCDLLVNEIVDDRGVWTGRKALNVGGFASCEAGSTVIEVDAEADARWTATIGSQ